jgi:HK97 family phage prohead protease
VTGRRGPISGGTYGKKPGPEADPGRQARLGRPGSKAKLPAKRARTTAEIFQAVNTDPPPVPAGLGPVGAAVWTDVWEALPILSPKLDHSAVLSFCLASEDAVRARAAIDEHGLLISEAVGDARGGALGQRLVLNPAEAALRRADKVLLELGDRLGLSPASRARLGLVLSLTEDHRGLRFDAQLDKDDPDARLVHRKISSGLMDQCSFAFRTVRQEWNADRSVRTISEVNLDRGDVSIVNYGASPTTSVDARSRRRPTKGTNLSLYQARARASALKGRPNLDARTRHIFIMNNAGRRR